MKKPINRDYILTEWLVLNAQTGDANAIEEIAKLWYPRLLRYARLQCKSQENAQDVVQETLLSMANRLTGLKDAASFPKWIYQILHRRGVDQIRKEIRRRAFIDDSKAYSPDDYGSETMKVDSEVDAINALSKLDKASAQLVHLHYLEELTIAEIAKIVNVPPGTVKSRLHTARQRLRKLLENKYE